MGEIEPDYIAISSGSIVKMPGEYGELVKLSLLLLRRRRRRLLFYCYYYYYYYYYYFIIIIILLKRCSPLYTLATN